MILSLFDICILLRNFSDTNENIACVENISAKLLVLIAGFASASCRFGRCWTSPFDWQVSVLDVDICGPSMPRIMGLEGEQVCCSLVSHL